MRISENMKFFNLLNDLNRSMTRIAGTQEDLTTSTTIHKPSDDPVGASSVLRLKEHLRRIERFSNNVEDAYQWVTSTEQALNSVTDIATQASTLLLQASNDTLGESERKIQSGQVQDLWSRVVTLANQKFGEKYLFSGTNTTESPYAFTSEITDETFTAQYDTAVNLDHVRLDGGSVTVTSEDGLTTYAEDTDYTIDYEDGTITVLSTGAMTDGDDFLISYETEEPQIATLNPNGTDGALKREIDNDLLLEINVTADEVFEGDTSILETLRKAANALERNDREALSALRTNLEEVVNTVTRFQGALGSKVQQLNSQSEKLELDSVNAERLRSQTEDTDVAKAILELQNEQTIYQAALNTGAQIIRVSLLDYM